MRESVARQRGAGVGLIQELIRQRSTIGRETSAQEVIAERLTELGCTPEWIETGDGRASVVARLRGEGGGPSLHLSGHVDVVPVDCPERWSFDPWGARISEGRIWGRGAGDMKAGIGAYLVALAAFLDCGGAFRGDLIFSSVIDEESGGAGMRAVLASGHVADATLIGEPSGLRLQHAGVGVVWAKLSAHSEGAHPAFASKLSPAIAMLDALAGLRELERWLNEKRGDPFFFEAFERPFRLNIGQLSGGVWPSSEPASVVARVRLGFGRDIDPQEAQRLLASVVTAAAPGIEVSFEGFRAPAYVHDLDSPLARALVAAHRQIHGEEPAPRVLAGTTDARLVGGQCLCYGPTAGNIHGIDEWVDIDSIFQVAEGVALTIARWQARSD